MYADPSAAYRPRLQPGMNMGQLMHRPTPQGPWEMKPLAPGGVQMGAPPPIFGGSVAPKQPPLPVGQRPPVDPWQGFIGGQWPGQNARLMTPWGRRMFFRQRYQQPRPPMGLDAGVAQPPVASRPLMVSY